MVTGRAARWRCHMWRSERPVGVNSTTTRKKRAEKVSSPEAVHIKEYYVSKIFYTDVFLFYCKKVLKHQDRKKYVPVWGERSVSCVPSVLSLPSIRPSSKTWRSWVSFPCCRVNNNNYLTTFRDWAKCFNCCGINTQTHISVNVPQTSKETHTNCLRDERRFVVLFFYGWPFTEVCSWMFHATNEQDTFQLLLLNIAVICFIPRKYPV